MTAHYLVKSPRHLAQYVATNLLTKDWFFYTSFAVPADRDPVLVDVKLLVKFEAFHSKERQYRRRKGGLASVKYLRCGPVGYLFATRGECPAFFAGEAYRDAREAPVHVAGHSIRVLPDTGKVAVRIHREAQRRLRKHLLDHVRLPTRDLEALIWDLDLLPFAGVRDGLFAAVRELNAGRRALRLAPVEWRNCVRKRFKVEPVFLPTPPEVTDLLAWYAKQR
ncbi:MAG: hypothetical protein K2X87_30880 [Gemmataceae bacterium]|nr:hypothetical protein [Gemmataceae bacterium]